MVKKKPGEMTFHEFWAEEKKTKADIKLTEDAKLVLLKILRRKGYSDEQINQMKMDKVWKICEPALWEAVERQLEATESSVFEFLQKAAPAFSSLTAFFENEENRRLLQTNKGLRKDLFDLAAKMDDLERSLFNSEEISQQILKDLKKKHEEKRRKDNSS